MPIDKEKKKLWVDALRSGKYQQTKGWLVSDDGYCCLGVACELAAEAGVCTKDGYKYDGQDRFLPDSVINWLGLPEHQRDPEVIDNYVHDVFTLSMINDGGAMFGQIADIIENQM